MLFSIKSPPPLGGEVVDYHPTICYNIFVETHRLLLSFVQFVDGDGKKTVACPSRVSGLEACMQLSREICPEGRRYIITLSDLGSICSIIGLLIALYALKKKK